MNILNRSHLLDSLFFCTNEKENCNPYPYKTVSIKLLNYFECFKVALTDSFDFQSDILSLYVEILLYRRI